MVKDKFERFYSETKHLTDKEIISLFHKILEYRIATKLANDIDKEVIKQIAKEISK
jgi:hypothetical protein